MDKTRLSRTLAAVAATPLTQPEPVAMKTVRREIQAIRRGTGGLLDVLLQQVWTYPTAGDSANALALMEVLADQDVPELSFASWHQSEIWDEGDRGIETVALSPRVA